MCDRSDSLEGCPCDDCPSDDCRSDDCLSSDCTDDDCECCSSSSDECCPPEKHHHRRKYRRHWLPKITKRSPYDHARANEITPSKCGDKIKFNHYTLKVANPAIESAAEKTLEVKVDPLNSSNLETANITPAPAKTTLKPADVASTLVVITPALVDIASKLINAITDNTASTPVSTTAKVETMAENMNNSPTRFGDQTTTATSEIAISMMSFDEITVPSEKVLVNGSELWCWKLEDGQNGPLNSTVILSPKCQIVYYLISKSPRTLDFIFELSCCGIGTNFETKLKGAVSATFPTCYTVTFLWEDSKNSGLTACALRRIDHISDACCVVHCKIEK